MAAAGRGSGGAKCLVVAADSYRWRLLPRDEGGGSKEEKGEEQHETFGLEEGVGQRRLFKRRENEFSVHLSYQRLKSQGHPKPIQTSDSDISFSSWQLNNNLPAHSENAETIT